MTKLSSDEHLGAVHSPIGLYVPKLIRRCISVDLSSAPTPKISSANLRGQNCSMLFCGNVWRPTRVERVIESFPTSTRVSKVMTDAGTGFLKGLGNPAGNLSLASELVGSELAAAMGLTVPPFAIIELDEIKVPMLDHGDVQFGPAFISRELPGTTSDGGDTFLRRLADPSSVARLIIFDTWVRNLDRCPPPGYLDPEPRRDNLFFTPVGKKVGLVALDHTHCFAEEDLETSLSNAHFVNDEQIYGLFPEFAPYVSERSLRAAIAAMLRVDANAIREIVNSIPSVWGPSQPTRDEWAAQICARGIQVAEHALARIVEQLEMGF